MTNGLRELCIGPLRLDFPVVQLAVGKHTLNNADQCGARLLHLTAERSGLACVQRLSVHHSFPTKVMT